MLQLNLQRSKTNSNMADQSSSLEQIVAHHSAAIAQINEILLLIARRQQESDRIQQGDHSDSAGKRSTNCHQRSSDRRTKSHYPGSLRR